MALWRSALWAALFATAFSSSAAQESNFVNGRKAFTPKDGGVLPGRFIIELAPAGKGNRARQEAGVDAAVKDINSLGYEATVKEDFSGVSAGRFNGASVQVTTPQNSSSANIADDITKLPSVVAVWPVHVVALNVTFQPTTGKPEWNPHVVTHAKELHDRGFIGKGQRVCVVDSGVDANHPALKGKIAGGKNLIDGSNNIADCAGHGTFVTSAIVADHPDFRGVAPDAQVYMYKIFGCDTATSTDLVIKGMLAADADGCDIINLSLGSDRGYRDAATSLVASRIAKDRLLVVAAGNAGEMGPFFASSPAVAPGVLSVGSVQAAQTMAWPAVIRSSGGAALNISYVTPTGAKFNGTIDVPLTYDTGDSCNIQSFGDADTAVISKRGVCVGRFAARSAEFAGYSYALAFDAYGQGAYYDTDVADYYYGELKLVAVTAASVGPWVKEQVAAGNTLRLSIEVDAQPAVLDATDIPSAGRVSTYSSWGPSYENHVSPQVVAPGGVVFGATPNGGFSISSGTSFSAPYVAGVAALYYAHAKKDKDEFIRRITSTCQALPAYNSLINKVVGEIGPVAQQGAGLINVASIFDHKAVLLSDPVLHLNDTTNRVSTHTIRVHNTGTEEVVYNVTHVPASTVNMRTATGYIYEYYPPLSDSAGSLQGLGTVSIPAGATREFQVTLSPPSGGPDSGALWSGKIALQSLSNNEAITIPYLGVELSTYAWGTLHHGPEVYRYDDQTGLLFPVDHWGVPYRPAQGDSPEVWFAFRYGTYEFSVDIVGEDWTVDKFVYPPVAGVGRDAWYGQIRQQPIEGDNPNDFPMREVVRFSRGAYVTFRALANGTDIPSGRYRVFSRALRIFGDARNPEDWQLFLSDSFPVQLGDEPVPTTTTSSATASSTASSSSLSTTSAATTSSTALTTLTTSAATSSTAVPTTTTTFPGITTTLTVPTSSPTPTGLTNALTSLTLARYDSEPPSPLLPDPNAWLELRIQIDLPSPVAPDSTIQFGIPPQLIDVAADVGLYANNGNAGRTSFDTNTRLFTIALSDWTTWNKNMKGDFYIMCRLDPAFTATMRPGTYVVEFPVAGGKVLQSAIYHGRIDRSTIYEKTSTTPYEGTSLFTADIEVPASVGPWEYVTFDATPTEDDGFVCANSSISSGYSLCGDKRMRNATDISAEALVVCTTKQFRARYERPVQRANQVLRFTVAGIQGDRDRWTYALTYVVSVKLNATHTWEYGYKTVSFEKNPRTRAHGFAEFTGERAVPIPES